jgi:hypothetical protein
MDESLSEAARQGTALLASDPSTPLQRVLDTALAAATRGRKSHPASCIVVVKSNDVARLDSPAPIKAPHAAGMGVAAVRDPDGPEAFTVVIVVEAGPKLDLPCQ